MPPRTGNACRTVADQAQARWQAGHLREARELFLSCSKGACGARSAECRAALQRLDQDIPSIIPVVTDEHGTPLLDVQVEMDGKLLISHLDGRGLPVDPGLHQFSFKAGQGVFHVEQVMIVEGQRNRVLAAQWTASGANAGASASVAEAAPQSAGPGDAVPAPALEQRSAGAMPPSAASGTALPTADQPHSGKRRSPIWMYAIGGAGVAAVGTSLLLVHWGSQDNGLLDRCAPNCKRSSVDHVRHMYIASDIALGTGVVALGVATWLFISDFTREKAPTEAAYTFDVKPRDLGAVATVGGRF